MRHLRTIRTLWILAAVVAATSAFGQDVPQVVPSAERKKALDKGIEGPVENKGIESVTRLGGVALAGEMDSLAGRELRVREIVVAPGGIVAVHQHDSRPGFAYILNGEIIEHRSDQDEPVVRRAGAIAFEKTGVSHWWENKSEQSVKALVADIVPQEPNP